MRVDRERKKRRRKQHLHVVRVECLLGVGARLFCHGVALGAEVTQAGDVVGGQGLVAALQHVLQELHGDLGTLRAVVDVPHPAQAQQVLRAQVGRAQRAVRVVG